MLILAPSAQVVLGSTVPQGLPTAPVHLHLALGGINRNMSVDRKMAVSADSGRQKSLVARKQRMAQVFSETAMT